MNKALKVWCGACNQKDCTQWPFLGCLPFTNSFWNHGIVIEAISEYTKCIPVHLGSQFRKTQTKTKQKNCHTSEHRAFVCPSLLCLEGASQNQNPIKNCCTHTYYFLSLSHSPSIVSMGPTIDCILVLVREFSPPGMPLWRNMMFILMVSSFSLQDPPVVILCTFALPSPVCSSVFYPNLLLMVPFTYVRFYFLFSSLPLKPFFPSSSCISLSDH